MVGWHLGGVDAHGDAFAAILTDAALGNGQELDGMADTSGLFHVLLGDIGDTFDRNVVDADARVEGQRGQDGALRCGIQALDVCGRVGLSEAQVLRLLEGFLVAQALGTHRVQDEVRRAVDNAHHGGDAVAGQRLAQTVHDGDRAGHGGLVIKVRVVGSGCLVQFGTVGGQQCLVARHDRNSLREGAQYERARRLDATDQLDHEVHPVNRLSRVHRQQLAINRRITRSIHIADEDATNLHLSAGTSREILAARLQDANDLATDSSSSKNANSEDRTGCRHRNFLLRETGTDTSVCGQSPPLSLRGPSSYN